MTAEVAILNKNAVALAADSKVSVGSGSPEKTYDTVNKIFTLSKVHPVGIMVYGNAEFMGFPWETIIKQYRANKRDRHEPTIDRWGEDFTKFVRGFRGVRKKDIAENIFNIEYSMFSRVEDETIIEAHQKSITLNSSQYDDLFLNGLRRWNDFLSHRGRLMSDSWFKKVINEYSNALDAAASQFVDSKNKKLWNAAVEFAARSLMADYFSPLSSGYVVAGFGRNEIFTAIVQYDNDGYVGGRVKSSRPSPQKTTLDNSSSIHAFAQHEIVRRFMEGIDPEYGNFLRGLFRTALVQSNLSTFKRHAPKNKQTTRAFAAIERAALRHYDTILKNSLSYREIEFEEPTLEMASLLPKDDLANLAEALDDRFHETTQLQFLIFAHEPRWFQASHMIRILEAVV